MPRHRRPTPRPPLLRRPTVQIRVIGTVAAVFTVLGLIGGANGIGDDFTPAAQTDCNHLTEGANPCLLDADADANGLDSVRRIARPVATSTSAPSLDSTAIAPPATVRTPKESPREQVGAFSGAPTVPWEPHGSSPTTESTPSTQPALLLATTTRPPDPTATGHVSRCCDRSEAPTTPTSAETTAAPDDTTAATSPNATTPTTETETTTVEPETTAPETALPTEVVADMTEEIQP